MRRYRVFAVPALVACAASSIGAAQVLPLSDADKERFLKDAVIEGTRAIDHGVTKPQQASLSDGKFKHDAQIQTINRELPPFIRDQKSFPNWDRFRYNIAAYRLDRILGLNMVPVTVPRKFGKSEAAFTWWVDDVLMEEVARRKKELKAPDEEAFARQLELGKVFDELIINIDRNLGNLLITKTWNLVLIDHTRTFTPYPGIRNPDNLNRCSRQLLASMKALTKEKVTAAMKGELTEAEIDALLQRRDKIVAFFEKRAAEKGEDAVLFP
jgi:hypothetical protein